MVITMHNPSECESGPAPVVDVLRTHFCGALGAPSLRTEPAGGRNECSKNRERTARTLWASPVPAIAVLRTRFYGALGAPSIRTEHFVGQTS